ncbi:T9SS type A sorting domain-containing protein, partial [candidate division KSB1 bacterium]|nr:T9SS type A sorting domain-containing protein [candidate division KSB1 bacterium]
KIMGNLKQKGSLIVVMNFLFFSTVLSQSDFFRVNAGGSGFTDTLGKYWASDQPYSAGEWGYVGGQTYETSDPIQNTTSDYLYQTERFWLDAYRFDIPNGTYRITLKFAEIWYTRPNHRLFSVRIEGQYVFQDLDIFATVGHDYALDYSYTFQVNDGRLDITFEHHEPYAHAKISGIEVVPASTTNPQLYVNPHNLDFGSSSQTRTFQITNTGTGSLNWNASENPESDWIQTINPASGTLSANQSQTVTVSIQRGNLVPGNYNGNISVTSNGESQNISIKMSVISAGPILSVMANSLDFGGFLTARKFIIRNSGNSDLNWNISASNSEPWLTSISPESGSLASNASQTVIVTVNRQNLFEGSFQNNLNITSNGGNATLSISIKVGLDTLRMNCGGTQYTDIDGSEWHEDFGFIGGNSYQTSSSIENTTSQTLYQTEHWGMSAYQFPVENKSYKITLHFAEIYFKSAGMRIFDVFLENSLILDDYDIFREVGANIATQKHFETKITDGNLDLNFLATKDDPKLSAIEITAIEPEQTWLVQPSALNFQMDQTASNFMIINNGIDSLHWKAIFTNVAPWLQQVEPDSGILLAGDSTEIAVTISPEILPEGDYLDSILIVTNAGNFTLPVTVVINHYTPYTQRVNAGGGAYISVEGDSFAADKAYQPGSWGYIDGHNYSTSRAISNTFDDLIYQSERWGLDGYIFDVPNGNYRVSLHFAEIYFTATDKRIMDVLIESSLVLDNWDIFAEAGNRTAVVKTFTISVNDNHLNVNFLASKDDPKISAIEVESIPPLLKDTEPELIAQNSRIKQVPEFRMHQNYPNPFNLETTITYELPVSAQVNITIFNGLGQVQTILVHAEQAGGNYQITWNGQDQRGIPVPSGIYFLRLFVKPNDVSRVPVSITRRMTIVK